VEARRLPIQRWWEWAVSMGPAQLLAASAAALADIEAAVEIAEGGGGGAPS